MKYFVYVLFSDKLNRFYIGNTNLLVEERLNQHNNSFNEKSFTTKGIPWVLFHSIECESRIQARKIELHLKKMKSKKYLENLKLYSEIEKKILERY